MIYDFNFCLLNSNMLIVLHWIVGLYHYGFLVNDGIGLINVIYSLNSKVVLM